LVEIVALDHSHAVGDDVMRFAVVDLVGVVLNSSSADAAPNALAASRNFAAFFK